MSSKEIKKSYLMWVGARHYSTIDDFVNEAIEMGISKRTVSSSVAEKLMEPGTVVFLAHDEGEKDDCSECAGYIDCPDCRKIQNNIDRLTSERGEIVTDKHKLPLGKFLKLISRFDKRIKKREERKETCHRCHGSGRTFSGTGGSMMFNDGTEMDYRQYMYWKRQPKKWTSAEHGGVFEADQCENCGGTGMRPLGYVFGVFVPSKIQYILKPEDDEMVKKTMEEKGFELIPPAMLALELPRGCGKRKNGGFYVVADHEKGTVTESSLLKRTKELVDGGFVKSDEVEITGNFARFLCPVEISDRRFRGLKKWSLNPRAEEEAEMILDAID